MTMIPIGMSPTGNQRSVEERLDRLEARMSDQENKNTRDVSQVLEAIGGSLVHQGRRLGAQQRPVEFRKVGENGEEMNDKSQFLVYEDGRLFGRPFGVGGEGRELTETAYHTAFRIFIERQGLTLDQVPDGSTFAVNIYQ